MNPIVIRISLSYTVSYHTVKCHRKGGVIFMEQITIRRFKRTQIILLMAAAILLFFGGCGRQGEESGEVKGLEPEPIAGSDDGRQESAGGESQAADGEREILTLPISREEAVVEYGGEVFMSSCRVIGGESIYLTGYQGEFTGDSPADSDYFMGRIGIGENQVREFSLEIPDDMFALRGCVDAVGRCHMLFVQKLDNAVTYEKMEIWVVNVQGEAEQTIDLATFPESDSLKQPWYWMAVDAQGMYYLGNNSGILVLDGETKSVWQYKPEGESLDGMGIGRSGALYGVFTAQDGGQYLGEIQLSEGTVTRCADFPTNGIRPGFSVLQPGVNTELLLANKGEGVWTYDGGTLELAVPIQDIIGNGQDILTMGFPADGRCCVMSYENKNYRFYYVPVEKEK